MAIMKKKSVQTALVLVLAVGIILAGTFAWFSFTQSATNVFEGIANPGGNLHDDYEEGDINKDVYVENSGSRPIYVRVKMSEFMDIDGKSMIAGGIKDQLKTWNDHAYLGTSVDNCGEAPHDHYQWVMGGSANDPEQGLKFYLPAPFENKARFAKDGTQTGDATAVTYTDNNEVAKAAAYGTDDTYATTETGKDAYDRINALLYTTDAAGVKTDTQVMTDLKALYVTLDNATGTAARKAAQAAIDAYLEAQGLGYWDKVYVVDDNGAIKPNGVEGTDYNIEFIPLRRTQTTAQIYTMAQWIAAGTPTGEFWIMDNDGWAYWGDVLQPNAATGLLLSEVVLDEDNKPAGAWYYGINVNLQAVTYDDITKFGDLSDKGGGGITDQGMMILQAASGNYAFDMEAGKTNPNDPVYTFVNNKDNTFRLKNDDGANTITYSPLFIYTGTVPAANKGDIYGNGTLMGDASYQLGKTFQKDIPFGEQGVVFTIAETATGSGTAVIEGKDSKHYVRLTYTAKNADGTTTAGAVAWLAVGANKKFDPLTASGADMLSDGDDVLVWSANTEPGTGAGDRFVEDASASYKIGDTFTKDSKDWVIIGMDTKTGSTTEGKTLIISKDVVEMAIASVDIIAKIEAYAKDGAGTLTELLAVDDTIKAQLLSIQDAIDYFSSNADRVATAGTGEAAKSTKWWLDGGTIEVNGSFVSPNDTTAADVGIRVAFWMNSEKLQEMLYPTTTTP